MVQAAMAGAGAALAPSTMFRRELSTGRLVQPFAIEIDVGRYWLTRSLGRDPSPAFDVLKEWLVGTLSTRPPPGARHETSPGTQPGTA
jgi:LysR family transcriptional regulator of beta-lactamase